MLKLFRKKAPAPPVVQRKSRQRRWDSVLAPTDRTVRITALDRPAPGCVGFWIAAEDGGHFIFKPGQYLTHCLKIDGQDVRRAYSIADASDDARQLYFVVKQIHDGQASRFLNALKAPGLEYAVRGPTGDFVLDDADAPRLFIAGGVGITPILPLVEAALARADTAPVALFYAARHEADLIFRQRLDDLAARHPQLELHYCLSQPPANWPGLRGHLDADVVRTTIGERGQRRCFLCGPEAMMDALAASFADCEIVREDFQSLHASAQRPTQPQTLMFPAFDATIEQPPGLTILEAGLAAGLPLNSSCTVGGCAACKLKLSGGSVVHDEPNCLTQQERDAGWVLACCAYATETATLSTGAT